MVVSFVEHDNCIVKRTATHKCKRCNLYYLRIHILLELGSRNHVFEGVVERLEIRVDFVFHISGKETEFLTGLYGRTRKNNFACLAVFEGTHRQCDGYICLAGAGRTECKSQVVVLESLHEVVLMLIARLNGLAVHAENNHAVALFYLRSIAFDYINNHILAKGVVTLYVCCKLMNFRFEIGSLTLLANDAEHRTTRRYAQLGIQILDKLHIGVVYTIKS